MKPVKNDDRKGISLPYVQVRGSASVYTPDGFHQPGACVPTKLVWRLRLPRGYIEARRRSDVVRSARRLGAQNPLPTRDIV